ncbi:hypothetical protein DEU56DRAFT_833214 [Suillus clintonianus]|uniref:uncharacterized protein n=1 Tax=Suillus clintonianus TaxID=1904413 RepID=UPI001B88496C|nr:uncharacterized protein DEU56DRAFT_833214 [Suillus clintonianus]KAG2121919.1 hypothetical protein DEU56DRAFT_833214 [Suillus clintonianus]
MSKRGPPYATLLFACSLFISVESIPHGTALLRKRAVPEIGGSQGGFIGLVVGLSVLILICCIAVFFLLRNYEPSEQERAARRERYRSHRDHQEYDSTAASAGLSSFGDKLRGMWADRRSSGSRSRSGGRRGGRGWIQAGSGDEWETDSDHGEGRGAQQPMQPFSRPLQEGPEMDSPLSDGESFTPIHYGDPYAKGSLQVTSPQRVTFARSQSPLSQSSSPMSPGSHRDASVDDEEVRPPDHRHFSTQSSTSVRTFEGGTKFIESL